MLFIHNTRVKGTWGKMDELEGLYVHWTIILKDTLVMEIFFKII